MLKLFTCLRNCILSIVIKCTLLSKDLYIAQALWSFMYTAKHVSKTICFALICKPNIFETARISV